MTAPPKKNYPKDILSRYDWKTWDIISSSHHPKIPSRFFVAEDDFPRSEVGNLSICFLGIHEAFRMFFSKLAMDPSKTDYSDRTIRIFFQLIFLVVVKGW